MREEEGEEQRGEGRGEGGQRNGEGGYNNYTSRKEMLHKHTYDNVYILIK